MLDIIQMILAMVVTLGILVTIHEYGHFWVARRCGVKVLRFSIGFGKPLFTWFDRHGTEFAVAAIPLGGYVKMLDEREAPVPEDQQHLSFNQKPVKQRFAIVAAGPIANFILAILAFWLMFLSGVSGIAPVIGNVADNSMAQLAGLEPGDEIVAINGEPTGTWQAVNMALIPMLGETGKLNISVRAKDSDFVKQVDIGLNEWLAGVDRPQTITALGIEPYRPKVQAKVGDIIADGPADQAGLVVGDIILEIENARIADWYQMVEIVQNGAGQALSIRFERNGQVQTTTLTPESYITDSGQTVGRVGIQAQPPNWPDGMLRLQQLGPVDALIQGVVQTGSMTVLTLDSLQKMITGLVSVKNLSGPITIAQVADQSMRSGLESFLYFLAILSISLGVLNLLPIPILDGGHLLYFVIEMFRGKPVSEKVQTIGLQVGLFIIGSMMVLAIYNDITRLIG